jgi:hypothetical protein
MLPRLALTVTLAILVSPRMAHAQAQPPAAPQPAVETQQYETPAYVAVVDGSATLERDGKIENAPLNMPLLSGDRLRTTDGRVEVRFADGGRLHLDSRTSLDVLSDELVRLGDGRIRLAVQRAYQVNYRVDSPVGSVRITQPGEYRVAIIHGDREAQLELSVIRGAGEIFTEQGTTLVRSGERANSSAGLIPSHAYAYNSAYMDEFDRWSEMQRGTVYTATSESSQYLPSDMGGYASTFDQYGDWRYQQSYGYVWYPRVAVGWRPYYYGRWAPYPTYGWTWITADPFGYPTHHYGRWGISAGAWFWIPSHYWGPAYVSWAYAPSYVSWCPLGWNNAAVFSIGFYNVGPRYYAGHYRGNYYSAWTTVPHGYFGRGYYAHQQAVNWDRPGYTGARPQFSEARTGPQSRDVAVARNAAPVRFAGTRTVAGGRNLPADTGTSVATRGRSEWLPPGDQAQARSGARTSQAETPRYINRGNEIVRSQTGRPIPPADTAVTRTTPPSAAVDSTAARRTEASRDGRVWQNSAFRGGAAAADAGTRNVDRAVPRQPNGAQEAAGDRAREQTQPPRTFERPGAGAAGAYVRPYASDRIYDRPYAGDRVYTRPYEGDRVSQQPSVGERAYERPSAVPRGPAGRPDAPRAMERSAPAAPPPAPAARPAERAAPAPAPRSGGGGGGDRAVPRAGGGAPSAPRGGGGRSR